MKNCLIYSVKADQRHLQHLNNSLKLVRDNLNPFTEDMDILFFCDPEVADQVTSIISELKITNECKMLEFNTIQPEYNQSIQNRIIGNTSYKNMCRFWAGEIFKNKEVLKYDYYMRLDCDSYITSPIRFNPFEILKEKNKIYGFISGGVFLDSPDVCRDLNVTLKQFEVDHPELIVKGCDFKEGTLYYTNFEICKVKEFAESNYMRLYEYLDKSGGIYILSLIHI